MSQYKDTRNGLVGADYSTKLSAWLALGCITARHVHHEMVKLEDGTDETYKGSEGYGKGENKGTAAVRFELLWRDYMRLCTMKFGDKLFSLEGFRQDEDYNKVWKSADKNQSKSQDPSPDKVANIIQRYLEGTTGLGLIDASQRELVLTGYTSNRARQNVASFFAKHLEIDWRYGAEWYEMWLVDYDVSSNWANWQYVSGVGNDPRGSSRVFNPVKQAFDYDKDGEYVRAWVPELRGLDKLENIFQACTTSDDDLVSHGLVNNIMVANPLKRIPFTVNAKPRNNRRATGRKGGSGRGGSRRGGGGRGGGGGGGGGGQNGSASGGHGEHHGGKGQGHNGTNASFNEHISGGGDGQSHGWNSQGDQAPGGPSQRGRGKPRGGRGYRSHRGDGAPRGGYQGTYWGQPGFAPMPPYYNNQAPVPGQGY
jgi:deoxyribodipyrimidine photo-lyase